MKFSQTQSRINIHFVPTILFLFKTFKIIIHDFIFNIGFSFSKRKEFAKKNVLAMRDETIIRRDRL